MLLVKVTYFWELRLSGTLRSIEWYLRIDISGQRIRNVGTELSFCVRKAQNAMQTKIQMLILIWAPAVYEPEHLWPTLKPVAWFVYSSYIAVAITSTNLVKTLEAKDYASRWQWCELKFFTWNQAVCSTAYFPHIFRCEYSESDHTCHWQSKPTFHQAFCLVYSSFFKNKAPGAHLQIQKFRTHGGHEFMALEYHHDVALKTREKLYMNAFFIGSLFNNAANYSAIRKIRICQ